ncbi:MAG: HDIG domain-containing protein [Spirochaetes bacterium]|jgi:putative nucleotidyltransferase with HDIG domain|nr:HDIG domain-containing protein [Spirochaetota bacterium]
MENKRDQAINLLKTYVKSENMLKHSLASEAVMKGIAVELGMDEEKWGLAGLLHDIDIELVNNDLSRHGLEAEHILKTAGFDIEIIEAVKMHNETSHGLKRYAVFHHALAAGETMTGLITATALVYPDKRLESVKVKSITKRMKEKAFAASVNRETIMECENIGIPIERFAEICLESMKGISGLLGL